MVPRPAICEPYSAGAFGAVRYHRETALRAPQFAFGDLAVTNASTDNQARMMTRDRPSPTETSTTAGTSGEPGSS